jgi:hypothetical protein
MGSVAAMQEQSVQLIISRLLSLKGIMILIQNGGKLHDHTLLRST